jgi:hypothetical protein
MKIPALTALTVVLSILVASAVHAGGKPTGMDFHSGASAALAGADWPPPPTGRLGASATAKPHYGPKTDRSDHPHGRISHSSSQGQNGGHVHNDGGRAVGSDF